MTRHADEAEVVVPAGPFLMGRPDDDLFAAEEERPQRRVFLSSFAIDVHPVTNRRYRAFVAAGGYTDRRLWSDEGWAWLTEADLEGPRSFDDPAFDGDDQPVGGVSWHEAQAFCAWAGRRLPTSAEWEKAARGDDGRRFPWGDQLPRRSLCNFDGRPGTTTPVGSYPEGVSPYGLHDMAGNVNNWVEDVFWAGFGAWCVREGRLRDPRLDEPLARELGVSPRLRADRGGGYLTAFARLEVLGCSLPLHWSPTARELWNGFRTARDVPDADLA